MFRVVLFLFEFCRTFESLWLCEDRTAETTSKHNLLMKFLA